MHSDGGCNRLRSRLCSALFFLLQWIFPTIGNFFGDFSNHWNFFQRFFQSLEKVKGAPFRVPLRGLFYNEPAYCALPMTPWTNQSMLSIS